MATKDIVIIPQYSGSINPTIEFSGSEASTIRLEVLESGSISFIGSAGTLLTIEDALTGSLFSVSDVSGLPIFEVFSYDTVVMGAYGSNALVVSGSSVGIGIDTPLEKLHVSGGAWFNGDVIIDGDLDISGSINQTNVDNLYVKDKIIRLNVSGSDATAVGGGIVLEGTSFSDLSSLTWSGTRWHLASPLTVTGSIIATTQATATNEVVLAARTITGTGALGGGGNLTSNQTISLNTPGTLSGTSTNSSTTNHTHAITGAVLSRTNDTNVTLTLGGNPNTALLNAASLTLGWSGQLSLSRGGTNANLTAVNGGIVYSTASSLAITSAGTSGQILKSAGAASPTWNTPAALTRTNDTNVTLTLGGSHATSLVNAASLTLGWTGQLSVSRGGTGLSSLTQGYIPFGKGTSAFGSSADLFWDETNSRLGIGTNAPSSSLHIDSGTGSLSTGLSFGDGDSGIYEYSDDILSFDLGGIELFRLDGINNKIIPFVPIELGTIEIEEDSGQVTIVNMPVSSNPSSGDIMSYTFALDSEPIMTVYSEADGTGGIQNKRIGIGTIIPSASLHINTDETGGNLLWIQSGSNEILFVSSSGNVGIGTTSPDSNLHLSGSGSKVSYRIENTNNTGFVQNAVDVDDHAFYYYAFGSQYSSAIDMFRQSGDAIQAQGSGGLSIGATEPSGEIRFYTAGLTAGNIRMVINKYGNVGIGTTSPAYKLDVSGNININGSSAYKYDTYDALKLATKGDTTSYTSTIIGRGAGDSVTDGTTIRQTAVGYAAGQSNSGAYQTAVGYAAGNSNSGSQVTGIGYEATRNNTANDVVAIGYQAGKDNTDANQFIVKQANINAVPLIQGDFSTGNVGIGTTSPQSTLHVNGTISGSGAVKFDSTIQASNIGADTDNTVVILNSSGYLKTDEIDSRVWGSSLVDGSGTANYNAYWSDANTITSEQYVAVSRGGTNIGTLTANKVMVGNGTSGVLTPTNLHWDNSNNRLGVNNTSPSEAVDVTGNIKASGIIYGIAKEFNIPHPTKPNKRLRHASIEAPSYSVMFETKLENTKNNYVKFPDYWKGLVEEKTIKVHVTPFNNYQKLYIKNITLQGFNIINKNIFNKKISATIMATAIRKDIKELEVEIDAN